jgi:bifunctional N-acetylglucosamine-1-phosphate-uridyltransferase/glucosamine-1-phosphate-acetyltransferase GlmU-like protein
VQNILWIGLNTNLHLNNILTSLIKVNNFVIGAYTILHLHSKAIMTDIKVNSVIGPYTSLHLHNMLTSDTRRRML